MKTLRLIAATIGLLGIGALRAADAALAPARAEVLFDHPENFTDVKDAGYPTDRGRDSILASIRNHVVSRTASLFPQGYALRIEFTDIDLAGDFEPWRGPQWIDVRVVKDIYPPALRFTYSVTDPSGKVVEEGSEDIRDLDFQMKGIAGSTDPLRYEKQILDDWEHSALQGLRKR